MVATTTALQRAQVGSRSFPLHLPVPYGIADDPPPTTDADDLEQDYKERTEGATRYHFETVSSVYPPLTPAATIQLG